MRRLSRSVLILVLSVFAVGGVASAKGASPTPPVQSPAVGAWLLTTGDDPSAPPLEVILSGDGTYIQSDGTQTSIGAWEPTGANSGAVTIIQTEVDEDGAVVHTTIRATFEVAEDGQSLDATYTIETIAPDGTSSGETGPGTATGTRIAVEPMGTPVAPLGTPVAPPISPAPSPGADAAAQTLDVALADFSVAISPTTVKAGEPITFAVTNSGATTHEMVLEKAGDDDVPLVEDGVESEVEDIAPGASGELVWTISEPGTYQLACHIPGHYEQGMVSTFEVVE